MRDPHQDGERGRLGRPEQPPGDRARSAPGSAPTRMSDSARTPSSEPPKSVGRGADEKRDHRRMVEIAEGERARPERVIGFVEGEFEPPGGDGLQGEQRDRAADRAGGRRPPRERASGRRRRATMEASFTSSPSLLLRRTLARAPPSHGRRRGGQSVARREAFEHDFVRTLDSGGVAPFTQLRGPAASYSMSDRRLPRWRRAG